MRNDSSNVLNFELSFPRVFWRNLPVQQPRINPVYRSYFCFPLLGMACKLQVKFLLSLNELPSLPSREFTPFDTLGALGYLLRVLEVKGRCDLFP